MYRGGNTAPVSKTKTVPGPHLIPLAERCVRIEIVRKRTFELKRDTTPHDPHAIYGVDQGFCYLSEDIAGLVCDHGLLRQ